MGEKKAVNQNYTGRGLEQGCQVVRFIAIFWALSVVAGRKSKKKIHFLLLSSLFYYLDLDIFAFFKSGGLFRLFKTWQL